MATNFKIKEHKPAKATTKAHYIIEREHERKEHNELNRLKDKIEKHINLPLEKAHKPEKGNSQKAAPLPNMRKY